MMRTNRLLSRLSVAAVFTIYGCSASFSPPMRSIHETAPGLTSAHEGTVAVAGALPNRVGATVSIPVAHGLRVEAHGDGSDLWVVGNVGVRATEHIGNSRVTVDQELGGGGGLGGARCGNTGESGSSCSTGTADGLAWSQRVAYGGYTGIGLGVRLAPWVHAFARARVQVSQATQAPLTFWASGLAGPAFRYGRVSWYGGVGYGGYANRDDRAGTLLVETGMGVAFDVLPRESNTPQ